MNENISENWNVDPCPFCGEFEEIRFSSKTTTTGRHICLYCNNCRCYGARELVHLTENYYSLEDEEVNELIDIAVRNWNTRTLKGGNYKIICCDNYNDEHIADLLVAENLSLHYAREIAKFLNDTKKSDSDYYRVVEQQYVLSRGILDLI